MNKPCKKCEKTTSVGKFNYPCNDKFNCEKYLKYEKYLESKRKYIKGESIKTFDELLNQEFVYIYGGIRHIAFVKSQQLNCLYNQLKQGRIYKAVMKVGE